MLFMTLLIMLLCYYILYFYHMTLYRHLRVPCGYSLHWWLCEQKFDECKAEKLKYLLC